MAIERVSKTVADVIAATKRQFGDTSGVQINDAYMVAWIDDAQREIVSNNPELKAAMFSVSTVAGTATYPLLANVPDILVVHAIHYKGQRLRNMTFLEAQEYLIRETQSAVTGDPWFWYEYAGVMTLYPVPETSVPAGLTVFYSQSPTPIVAVNDVLSLPDSYFNSIVDYVMWHAYEMDSDFASAQVKQQQFEQGILRQANRQQAQDNYYPTVTLLPEDNIY